MKLRCSTLITALIMALSVFVGTMTKSEVKSQIKKRKEKKLALVEVEEDFTNTQDVIEDV